MVRHEFGRSRRRDIGSIAIGGAITMATAAGFLIKRYRVSKPNEYLVMTGFGIRDILITKQGLQRPFQKYKFINMHPTNYTFNLHAMSIERIDFILPGVFTIGPKDDKESLVKYARILEDNEQNENEVDASKKINEIILGILEGEVRALSSQMTIEEIFNNRKLFKETVIKSVQVELDQVGLWIYNANIKELQDGAESKYFRTVHQKKISEVENSAKVDVAYANKFGDIGQKEREAMTRQQVAQYESETIQQENKRSQEIERSNAELKIVQADAFKRTTLARIESEKATEVKEAELQTDVENKRIAMQTEYLKSIELSQAQISAECQTIQANANLCAKQKEAEGILAIYQSQSDGIKKMIESVGNNPNTLIQYLMIERGIYQNLADTNARAI